MNKFIFIFLCSVSFVCGQKAGLRVKYGNVSEEAADKDFFFAIPRTVRDAEAKGWQDTVRPLSPLPHLKMFCPVGKEVCALYHPDSKFVAGLQLALPIEEFSAEPRAIEKYFDKWTVPALNDEPAKDFWAITQYFLPKESNEIVPTEENGATLQFDGIWVRGPDGNLMEVPVNETILKVDFAKQACTPKMGTHYYFHSSLSCDGEYPWIPLVKEGKLIGTGFSIYAKRTKSCSQCREWYEYHNFPVETFAKNYKAVLPTAPLCYIDLFPKYKFMALHIYYIDEPWKVTCSPDDSIKPLPEAEATH